MTRRLVFGLLLVCLLGCESFDEAYDAAMPASDTSSSSEDADAAPEVTHQAVSCDALAGQWQLTICDTTLAPAQLVVNGCELTILSAAPELHGGQGRLEEGWQLSLTLPGGAWGQLSCVAEARRTSFTGECATWNGSCSLAAVRAW